MRIFALLALEEDALSNIEALPYNDKGVPELAEKDVIAPKEKLFRPVGLDGSPISTGLDNTASILNQGLKITFTGSTMILQIPSETIESEKDFEILTHDVKGKVLLILSSIQIQQGELRWNVPKAYQGKLLLINLRGKSTIHTQKVLVPII